VIQFENVSMSYGTNEIIKNINFTIEKGQFVVLIGPSGCGKTTTLKIINRLIEPAAGRVLIGGRDTSAVNRVELRRSIGYVIQQIGLFPNMTVAQNICVVPKLLGYHKQRCAQIVREMLEMVNMPVDQYAEKYPSELSGGQQQRIGVLRALAASPPIVLMDEPFGALDPMTRAVLQEEILRLQKKLHKTIVFVTHDMEEALTLADVILFMENGSIVQMAPPEEMLRNPASDTVRSFLGKHIKNMDPAALTAADFMKKGIVSARADRSVFECTSLMARKGVDTLVIVDDDGRYLGTLSVEDIRLHKDDALKAGDLMRTDHPAVHVTDSAKGCFDILLSSSANKYVIVLSPDGAVAGIITKTGIARALAEKLWG